MRELLYILLGIVPLSAACDHEEYVVFNYLNENIEKDIAQRFPNAQINSIRSYQDQTASGTEVNLTDRNANDVSIFYKHDRWSLTVTKIRNFQSLPYAVKTAFHNSSYGNMNKNRIKRIECVQYKDLSHAMYKIDFTYYVPGTGELYTLLMFNEDGFMLPVLHHTLNDSWWHKTVNPYQKNFTVAKYGADIRAYNNDGGHDCYYVLDGQTLKHVSFDDDRWVRTTFALPYHADIPTYVTDELRKAHPGFIYNQAFFIESPEKNMYQFLDHDGNGFMVEAW